MSTPELVTVTAFHREQAVDYAKRRNMPKATIAKYGSAAGDAEPIVQAIARACTAVEEQQKDRIASLEHANSVYITEINELKTKNSNQAANISNVCSQLDSIKGQNAAKASEIQSFRDTLLAIRKRALGSIFGKGKDIADKVDAALYIPGE